MTFRRNVRAAVRRAAYDVVFTLFMTFGAAVPIRLIAGSWDLATALGLVFATVSLIRLIILRRRSSGAACSTQQQSMGAVARRPMARWGSPWLPARISVSSGTVLAMGVCLYLSATTALALEAGLALALLAPQPAHWTIGISAAALVAVIAGLRIRKLLPLAVLAMHGAFPIEIPRSPS